MEYDKKMKEEPSRWIRYPTYVIGVALAGIICNDAYDSIPDGFKVLDDVVYAVKHPVESFVEIKKNIAEEYDKIEKKLSFENVEKASVLDN